MRVAWVVYGTLDQPTGGYVYDRIVVEGLRRAGDDLDVISIDPGARIETLDTLDHDVIVGDALCVRELADAFERARAPKCLLVHHLTSWEPDRESERAFEARAIAASTTVVTTSASTAARVEAEHPGTRAHVVTPGADRLPLRPRRASEDGAVTLLSVGSLIPRKRLDLVLDVLCRLDLLELALRVVGDETRDAQAARLLRARGAPRTTFLGTLSDAALSEELACADALILASTLEGYGMVLTEACYAGLPAIVARSAALPEVALSEEHVLVFDEAPDLERTLRRFVADPALRASLSAAAAERASTLPRWVDAQAKFREIVSALRR